MFSSSASHPDPSSIKEANEQLQSMYTRIVDLEQRVREQCELLERREQEQSMRVRQLAAQKDSRIAELRAEVERGEQRLGRLEAVLKERDVQMAYLLHRSAPKIVLDLERIPSKNNCFLFPTFPSVRAWLRVCVYRVRQNCVPKTEPLYIANE